MTTDQAHRSVTLTRTEAGKYAASNARGGQIMVGGGNDADMTPVELLLAAIGGCTSVDVDLLTSRRAEPEKFEVVVGAEKIHDELGNRLADITVTFRLAFGEGEDGDKARAVLPVAVKQSHDRLCTVSRTVEIGTPITPHIE
jgi:putative redox protein